MNAQEMIERLRQLDPDTEIVNMEVDFDYYMWTAWEIEDVEDGGGLVYGRIVRSGCLDDDEEEA